MKTPHLVILGRPLNENAIPSSDFLEIVKQSDVIIGESRKVVQRIQDRYQLSPDGHIFLLDNLKDRERQDLEKALSNLVASGGTACLFSDMGMPILFDPGKEILAFCRKKGFAIKCLPGPTSWGTACALSGWSPPFFVVGFLPPKTEERFDSLRQLKLSKGHLVLMDTPYRFRALLRDCLEVFGAQHSAFLAWEIGEKEQFYAWENLKSLEKIVTSKNLEKGEFILLLEDPSVK